MFEKTTEIGAEETTVINSRETGGTEMTGLEIAIIGMAGRFPGAENVAQYWENLLNGKETVTFSTEEELREAGIDGRLIKDPNYVNASAVIDDYDSFDAAFFGYTPREAEIMAPQIRVFHEVAWSALEDAGYEPGSIQGAVGVYAGSSSSAQWETRSFFSGKNATVGPFAAALLVDKDHLSTRVSYNLDLKGPSFSMNTQCSTSLIAVHLACQGLLSGECGMAVAGAVTLFAIREKGYLYQDGGIFSSDGHSRAFDAKADGTLDGEGAGCVVLKCYEDARADGDHIYAIIKGSAINNDGSRKVGYSAPSVKMQASVIRNALNAAEVSSETIGYIEAHGSATKMGDPIELKALNLAFDTDKKGYCGIGSAKTNVGHLIHAAGMAGIIKTALALKHGIIPPSLHYETPNPEIDFENSPFYVVDKKTRWERGQTPRRAGVSAFGIGGSNGHVILEEAPLRPAAAPGKEWNLLMLSARTETSLQAAAENLARHIEAHPGISLSDVAYTLHTGRRVFDLRRAVVVRDAVDAVEKLAAVDARIAEAVRTKDKNRPVIFMFPGLGAQYENMALDLYRKEPVFRREMDRCFDSAGAQLDYDLKARLYPGEAGGADRDRIDGGDVHRVDTAQLQVLAVEYALAKLLMAWGITPDAMIGYSFGEYTAAVIAGVMSLEAAIELVVTRGQLIRRQPGGVMLSVPLTRQELEPRLEGNGQLAIAIDNGPSVIAAGPAEAVEELEARLKSEKIMSMRLPNTHAIHTPMMAPIREAFENRVRAVQLGEPEIPYVSNVTGDWITPGEATDPGYWGTHLAQQVRFADGIRELMKKENAIYVEVGPGRDLCTLLSRYRKEESEFREIDLVRHPEKKSTDREYLLKKLGRLWQYGRNIDGNAFYEGEKRQRIPLPTYSFEKQRYWINDEDLSVEGLRPKRGLFEKNPNRDEWYWMRGWEHVYIDAPGPLEEIGSYRWLVLGDDSRWGRKIQDGLRRYTDDVTVVGIGREYHKRNQHRYDINPGCEDDYMKILEDLKAQGRVPEKIVHHWCLEEPYGDVGLETLEESQTLGIHSLLNLARSIANLNIQDKIQVEVITSCMHEVTGGEPYLRPEKSTLLGPVKIVPLEYNNIDTRSIDIVLPPENSPGEQKLLRNILQEMITPSPERIVAYRGNYRWMKSIRQIRMPVESLEQDHLEEKGVYLITGGFGGMGFTIAEHLGKTKKARLILVGRTALPPREQWEKILEEGPEESLSKSISKNIAKKIRTLMECEQQGAEILICKADASNLEQMTDVLREARRRFGAVNGVFHTAGVIDYGGIIQTRKRKDTDETMAAKVRGTMVLDRVLEETPLDFFVLFSTFATTGYRAKFGQVGYVAGSDFENNYGYYKTRKDGTRAITINWVDWNEVGMAVEAYMQDHAREGAELGSEELYRESVENMEGLLPQEGIQTLNRILRTDFPRVCVSPWDTEGILEHLEKSGTTAAVAEDENLADNGLLRPRPQLDSEYEAPRNQLEKMILKIWENLFGLRDLGVHDDFFELGGDSLIGMTMVNQLKDRLDEIVHITVIFEARTAADLAIYLQKHYPGAVSRIMKIDTAVLPDEVSMSRLDAAKIAEVRSGLPVQPIRPGDKKAGKAVFILAPGRSGTTLMRVMLGGHPQLFAPPEFGMMIWNDLEEREAAINDKNRSLLEGPVRAIMEIKKCSYEEANEIMDRLAEQKMTTPEFFDQLHHWLAESGYREHMLVDKTPEYSMNLGTLERIEAYFDKPLYIHLQRHPYGVIHSFEEARLDLLLGEGELYFTRKELAELSWTISHQNIVTFLENIPPERKAAVRFEDLTADPRPAMERLCSFMELEFNEEMLQPYKEKKKRMTDGVREGGMMIGDVKFHRHKNINPEVAEKWRRNYRKDFLSEETWKVAKSFGYSPITSGEAQPGDSIEPVGEREYYELSSAQKRLYTLQQMAAGSTTYNIPVVMGLEGPLERREIEAALKHLVERHDVLRTSFHMKGADVYQVIAAPEEIQLQVQYDELEPGYLDRIAPEGTGENARMERELQLRKALVEGFIRPFDLTCAPLLRARLLKVEDRHHILMLDVHHIVSDGTSFGILIREMLAYCKGRPLPELRLQYRDYAAWQNRRLKSEKMKKQEEYWLNVFADGVPKLEMPLDYPRPAVKSPEGEKVFYEIDETLTAAIRKRNRETDTTLYMILLAAYNLLLHKYTGQTDIVVGSPVSGRHRTELENQVGIYLNMMTLRNRPEPGKTVVAFLEEVRANALSVYENQEYPFDELVGELGVQGDPGRNPLFDMGFVLQKAERGEGNEEVTVRMYGSGNPVSRFDMLLNIAEVGERLSVALEYSTSLFKRASVDLIFKHYKEILQQLVEPEERTLADIVISTKLEVAEPAKVDLEFEF